MTPRARRTLLLLFAVSLLAGLIIAIGRTRSTAHKPYKDFIALGNKVGLVRVDNVIEDAELVVDQLEELRQNPSVSALVIRVNSPGGGVAAVQEIYEEILRFHRDKKPVVISMAGVAASGGYYIACAADKVFANPGTITGSIGVIFEIPETQELLKKIGVGLQIVKSGKFKDTGNFTQKLSVEERAILQELVDDTFAQFMEAVKKGRKMSARQLATISDGRIVSGRQALDLGLIDTLGTLNDAIDYAGKTAGIKGTPGIEEPKRKRSRDWGDLLFQSIVPRHLLPAVNGQRPMLRYQVQ